MISYETYEQKNTLEHKIVTRGKKIDKYVELLHDIIPLTRKRYGHLS